MPRRILLFCLALLPAALPARFALVSSDPARLVYLVAIAAVVLVWLIRRNRNY